jgi:hypothetical protein
MILDKFPSMKAAIDEVGIASDLGRKAAEATIDAARQTSDLVDNPVSKSIVHLDCATAQLALAVYHMMQGQALDTGRTPTLRVAQSALTMMLHTLQSRVTKLLDDIAKEGN